MDLLDLSLCVTVWSWNAKEDPDFLGGIIFPLQCAGNNAVKRHWYNLEKELVRNTMV